MLDIQKLDWEKLKKPSDMFTLFTPKPDDERLRIFAKRLYEDYLYLPDEFREYKIIYEIIKSYFSWHNGINLFYEIGDFQGLAGFINIIPEYKAEVMLKFWGGKELWSKQFVKEGRALLKLIMDEWQLRRMGTESPDEKIVKMALMFGFEDEGKSRYAFRWKNEFYDNYKLGLISNNKGE